MALESGTFISDLVVTNPTGSDALAFADDHLRLIKSTVKASFPSVSGAVTKTHTQINDGLEKAGGTMTGALVLSGAPTVDLNPATKKYVDDIKTATDTSLATKAAKTITVSAGTGLSGGGDLTTNRTLAISEGGVGTTQIAATAVTTAKIADSAVTAAKIADSTITAAKMASGVLAANAVGVGQTWQMLTGSRVVATTYTNNTGKPIMLLLGVDNTSFYIDDVLMVANSGSLSVLSVIIPNLSTYRVEGSFGSWAELR